MGWRVMRFAESSITDKFRISGLSNRDKTLDSYRELVLLRYDLKLHTLSLEEDSECSFVI